MSETLGTRWEVLEIAHLALRSTVLAVAPGDWKLATPCQEWNVTQVLQHAAGDQLAFVAAITGSGGPSENPFTPSGEFAGTPLDTVDQAVQASQQAWSTVGEESTVVPTPLPQGTLAPWIGVGACALDAAVHAWDIAVATGQRSPISASLAGTLMPAAAAIVEPLRGYGAYAPALTPEPDDDPVGVLLRYLGRQPGWTP